MKFTATIEITPQQIADQMTAAIESSSGSHYWSSGVTPKSNIKHLKESHWYADPVFWAGEFVVEVKDGENRNKKHLMTPETMQKGIQYLLEHHGWRIEQIVKETGDAETGDVLLQAAVFGDIVYG